MWGRGRAPGRDFNPLHCGAVVASIRRDAGPGDTLAHFNPLHCGAVVASLRLVVWLNRQPTTFQSPSLRGSGRFPTSRKRGARRLGTFQSPSLRGSGRFGRALWRAWAAEGHFNPLHCGAVVASVRVVFNTEQGNQISIPFIAGQWSLPRIRRARSGGAGGISIPFIAGQWSLHTLQGEWAWDADAFQSPSLRGSGRFSGLPPQNTVGFALFQSPSLRGSGRFRGDGPPAVWQGGISIPFIAGQWSLPGDPRDRRRLRLLISIPFIAGQWSLRGVLGAG